MTVAWKLFVAAMLVLLNGFFVAAELALVKVRETQLAALAAQRRRGAATAVRLKRNLNAAITATQLGITLAGMGLGRYVEPMVEVFAAPLLQALGLPPKHWAYGVLIGLGFVVMSFVLMIFGEALPKALAINKTETVVLTLGQPLTWWYRLARPFIWIVNGAALWLARKLGVEALDHEPRHSPEELRFMLLSAGGEPHTADFGRNLVLNALDLRRRVVAEVMRPRREITSLSTQDSIAACLEIAERSRYSRFPLCEDGNLDHTLGVVHFKDLFSRRDSATRGADLQPVARKLIFVPETARLERLLQLFLDRRSHFAFVVDEYGSTVGMATLENVVEEVVGQIQDEFDHEKPRLTRRGDQAWELDASLPLFELAELTGESLDTENATTINGWITKRLGRFPKRSDRLVLGAYELSVEELDGLRVSRVLLQRRPSEVEEAPASSDHTRPD
ncbi:MAG TPA: hypothetical protein DCE44_19150 [Verrucomicrobiales bacterium]|nr:hypothetical protein [Verrucomicrobiales bacterium]